MNEKDQSASPQGSEYEVHTCTPALLSAAEISVCADIVVVGDAVDSASARRNLPRARLLAIARTKGQIVGVAAIKHERPWYAAKTSRDSGVDFAKNTLELGYVAVLPAHQNKKLSQRLVKALLAEYTAPLFATTYTEYMKRTLGKAGFANKGKEWQGRRHMVSFWEKGADAPEKV